MGTPQGLPDYEQELGAGAGYREGKGGGLGGAGAPHPLHSRRNERARPLELRDARNHDAAKGNDIPAAAGHYKVEAVLFVPVLVAGRTRALA